MFSLCCCRGSTVKPQKLVKKCKVVLNELNGEECIATKADEKLTRYYWKIEDMICWKLGFPPTEEDMCERFAEEFCEQDVLSLMIQNMPSLGFEGRRISARIYWYFIEFQIVQDYLLSKPELLQALIDGCGDPNASHFYALMLQKSCYYEPLARVVLYSDNFYNLFTYIGSSMFHVSSAALNPLKDLLMDHKKLSSNFLMENYDKIIPIFNEMIKSGNYCLRCDLLELLSWILRAPEYRSVMFKYTKVPEHLNEILPLFRRKSKYLQYEAFRVFAVFAVCPEKTEEIVHILLKYRKKIVRFLKDFQEDREDAKFHIEKEFVIKKLNELTSS